MVCSNQRSIISHAARADRRGMGACGKIFSKTCMYVASGICGARIEQTNGDSKQRISSGKVLMTAVTVAMLCLSCRILISSEDMESSELTREEGRSSSPVACGGTGHALLGIVQSEAFGSGSNDALPCGEAPNGSESAASFSSVQL